MAAVLPPEIIADILCRLPVKDLLRYRCVSKPWRSLIDGHDFAKAHVNHSSANLGLLVKCLELDSLHWVNLDTLDSAAELDDYPINFGGFGTNVLGSCNGLLALRNSVRDVALWNPTTKWYHILPTAKIRNSSFGWSYGFGYDPINDDYKLVKIVQVFDVDGDSVGCEAEVYSLRANTWSRIKDFPHYPNPRFANGVFVSHALHWIVSRKPQFDPSSDLVGAFDLVTEEYRELHKPDYVLTDNIHVNVEVLGGCLCLVCNYYNREISIGKSERVDIWVMKEYGVKESWTKLYSVSELDLNGCFSHVTPAAYLKPRHRVLMDVEHDRFAVYDLETKTVENVAVPGLPYQFEVLQCMESLVGLGGRNGEIRGKKGLKQEEKQKRRRRSSCLMGRKS